MARGQSSTALFVMPSFERHAARRDWEDLEDFYNPESVFGRVILVSLGAPQASHQKIGRLEVVPVPHDPHPHLVTLSERAYGTFDRVARAVERIARDAKADLLVQRYGSPLWHGMPVIWAARRLNKPSLITYQADYRARAQAQGGVSAWLRTAGDAVPWSYLRHRATKLWTVSEFLAARLIEQGVTPRRIVTIPNKDRVARFGRAVSPAERSQVFQRVGATEWDDGEQLFLCVGRLIPEKNLERVVRAFAELVSQNRAARLLIVGQGPLEASLKQQIQQLGISDSARLSTTYLSQSELAVLYQRALALVFCSTSEGQGRVAFEALAAGTPVIGARLEPIAEMVTHEENGLLVEPTSVSEITTAMQRFASGELTKEAWSAACTKAARRFDISVVNEQEAALYRSLLSGQT